MDSILLEVKEQLLKRGAEVVYVSPNAIKFVLSGEVYSFELKWMGSQ